MMVKKTEMWNGCLKLNEINPKKLISNIYCLSITFNNPIKACLWMNGVTYKVLV